MTEQKTTHTPKNTTPHTNQRRRPHNPCLGTSTRLLSPCLSLLSCVLSIAVSSSLPSPLSSSAGGGGRSCLILVSVLLACSLVSLSLTWLKVSVAFLRTITPLRPHNFHEREGGGVYARGRGGEGGRAGRWEKGLNVRGKEGEGRKTNFFPLEQVFRFFSSGYVFFYYLF